MCCKNCKFWVPLNQQKYVVYGECNNIHSVHHRFVTRQGTTCALKFNVPSSEENHLIAYSNLD